MTTAKQLVVTGSDTALRVSIFCANHYQASTTVDKSQLAIFLSLETYFITIKICTVFSTLPDSLSDSRLFIQERLIFFIMRFPCS